MKALVIVDVQNDFADPKGSLYVSGGEKVVPVINDLIKNNNWDKIIFSQDWHPNDHESFAKNSNQNAFSVGKLHGFVQTFWPNHCIQDKWGSQFHKNLNIPANAILIKKGTDKKYDSYSALFDNNGNPTGLAQLLDDANVTEIYIAGLATDYCIKFTAIDCATKLTCKPKITIITNGCKAVNINKYDGDKAIGNMKFHYGIKTIKSLNYRNA